MKAVLITLNPNFFAPLVFRTKDNQVHQKKYYGSPMVDMGDRPAHLYILSDEEPKSGDFCFNTYDNSIWQYKPSPCPMPYWGNAKTLIKIEASTDSDLRLSEIPKEVLVGVCNNDIEVEFFLKHTI